MIIVLYSNLLNAKQEIGFRSLKKNDNYNEKKVKYKSRIVGLMASKGSEVFNPHLEEEILNKLSFDLFFFRPISLCDFVIVALTI
jgi:hypothetical protein